MLQWMGGSRRKVTTTRKSTYNRQKQYFEQRKRKQQTTAPQDNTEGMKKITCNEGSRSLDILSLASFTTASQSAQHEHCMQSIEKQTTKNEVTPTISHVEASLDILPKYDTNFHETCTSSHHETQADLQHVSASASDTSIQKCIQRSDNNIAQHRNYTSFSYNDFQRAVKKGTEHHRSNHNVLSVLDMLDDDGSTCEERLTSEDHVAFSVEGLGRVGTRTPINTPRKTVPQISSSAVDFQDNFSSISAPILDVYGLEDTKMKNTYPAWQGCFNSINTSFNTHARADDIHLTNQNYTIAPRAKRRMLNGNWEMELDDGCYDEVMPKTIHNVPLCFDQKRHSEEKWLPSFEHVINNSVWPLSDHENIIKDECLWNNEGRKSESPEGIFEGRRTADSWLGDSKHWNRSQDFKLDLWNDPSGTRSSMDMGEFDLEKSLDGLGCSVPMKSKWDSGIEHYFEKPSAFNENTSFFPVDNKHSCFDAYAMQDFVPRTSQKNYNSFDYTCDEDNNFNAFEDYLLHPGKGQADGKPAINTIINDDPFSKFHLDRGKVKERYLVNQFSNLLFTFGGEDGHPIGSFPENLSRNSQSAETPIRPIISKDSSNESNILPMGNRETPIAEKNKSSVEDNGSSSKFTTMTASGNDCSEHAAEPSKIHVLFDGQWTENPHMQTETSDDVEKTSLKQDIAINNLYEGSDAAVTVPLQCRNDESPKGNSTAKGANCTNNAAKPSCQVMFQSYVLQLLCVQKVLTNSSV